MIIFRFGDEESVYKYNQTETTDIDQACYKKNHEDQYRGSPIRVPHLVLNVVTLD